MTANTAVIGTQNGMMTYWQSVLGAYVFGNWSDSVPPLRNAKREQLARSGTMPPAKAGGSIPERSKRQFSRACTDCYHSYRLLPLFKFEARIMSGSSFTAAIEVESLSGTIHGG